MANRFLPKRPACSPPRERGRPHGRARCCALLRIGWTVKRQAGSHCTLSRPGWPDYVFAFHDADEIGPRIMARVAEQTGLRPGDLWRHLACGPLIARYHRPPARHATRARGWHPCRRRGAWSAATAWFREHSANPD
ncbi:MAG: type II toxin-antitoxin system HicA family toxin [Acetobacteraceae bacterium]